MSTHVYIVGLVKAVCYVGATLVACILGFFALICAGGVVVTLLGDLTGFQRAMVTLFCIIVLPPATGLRPFRRLYDWWHGTP